MSCPYCGASLRPDARFCSSCGRALPQEPTEGTESLLPRNGGDRSPEESTEATQSLFHDRARTPPENRSTDTFRDDRWTREETEDGTFARSWSTAPAQSAVAGKSWYGRCSNCGGTCRVSENLCDNCKRKKKIWAGVLIGLGALLVLGGLLAALFFTGVIGGAKPAAAAAVTTPADADQTTPADADQTTPADADQTTPTDPMTSTEPATTEPDTADTPAEQDVQQEQTPSDYQGISDVANNQSGYILPYSDSRYLTEADLRGLNQWECCLARNELYARHGRIFTDSSIQAYFDSCPWYTPTTAPEDFDEAVELNEYERANRDTIVRWEQKKGYRN